MNPQQILERLASVDPVAKAELERMRSELRQAYADRAQAIGTNESVSQLIWKIDLESEALISVLDNSGSLDGENTQRAAYKLRLAVVQARGDEGRITAARESLSELDATLDDDDVQDVVDDVAQRAEKFGFQPDEDMVRGAVEESANLLNIALTEEQIVDACERIMQPEEKASERQLV